MATITGLTAVRMLAIEAASIVSGAISGDNLMLTKHDGTVVNAGNVRGPTGATGATGPAGVQPPTGCVLPFAGGSAPTGWLLAQGQEVSRTTYATLFSTIGTTYGAGDGSTTFKLPDLRDRSPIGASGSKALGTTGGAETQTLVEANLPPHAHTIAHTHTPATADQWLGSDTGGTANRANGTSWHAKGVANSSQPSTPNSGDGNGTSTAFSILPKYQAMNYIIKT